MEQLRHASGVTDEEKATVELEDASELLFPPAFQSVKIKSFPTPGSVITQVIHPERQKMLKRLYP